MDEGLGHADPWANSQENYLNDTLTSYENYVAEALAGGSYCDGCGATFNHWDPLHQCVAVPDTIMPPLQDERDSEPQDFDDRAPKTRKRCPVCDIPHRNLTEHLTRNETCRDRISPAQLVAIGRSICLCGRVHSTSNAGRTIHANSCKYLLHSSPPPAVTSPPLAIASPPLAIASPLTTASPLPAITSPPFAVTSPPPAIASPLPAIISAPPAIASPMSTASPPLVVFSSPPVITSLLSTSPPTAVASPPPAVASPPLAVASPPPAVASPPPAVASPPLAVSATNLVATASPGSGNMLPPLRRHQSNNVGGMSTRTTRRSLPPPTVPAATPTTASLEWVDAIEVEHLVKLSCPLTVPRIMQARWLEALERSAELCSRTARGPPQDNVRAWKLLQLLPIICSGRWAGRKEARAAAKAALPNYPVVSLPTAAAIVSLIKSKSKAREAEEASRTKAVLRHLAEGHPKKAARVLMSHGLATMDADGIAKVKNLHPPATKPDLPMPSLPHPDLRKRPPGLAKALDEVIDRLPRQSAAGVSGWSYAMVQDAWKRDLPAFKALLRTLVFDIIDGKPIRLHEWLVASKLICLRKPPPSEGIRPIACGETFVRIAARLALTLVAPQELLDQSLFGGGKGGTEPMIWSMADAVDWAEFGVAGVDFENAFNTVSRQQMAQEVMTHAPKLAGIFSTLYNRSSKLVTVDANGDTVVIESASGGRQGDPLMPLLFSMVMKPISTELDRFTLETTPTEPLLSRRTPDEAAPDAAPRTLKWSLLDDLNLAPNGIGCFEVVLNFLDRPEFKDKYGLSINRRKCWYRTQREMIDTGMSVLGSWVGGPNNERSHGSQLTIDAAQLLEERVAAMGPRLTIQQKLILLRLCFVPTLNHLLRTLPPRVGVEGVEHFDRIVFGTVMSWVNDRSLTTGETLATTKAIVSLPHRYGGLGFANQTALKPICVGASFVLSQGVLRDLGMSLSERLLSRVDEEVRLCADNLDLPVSDLLSNGYWDKSHLQRRMTELPNEQKWKAVWDAIPDAACMRRLEAGGPIARAWLRLIPSDPSLVLADDQVRHGLRYLLLSDFADTTNADGKCKRCNHYARAEQELNPCHFATCDMNQMTRTFRHTAVARTISKQVEDSFRTTVQPNHIAGLVHHLNGGTEEAKSDIYFPYESEMREYDLGITALRQIQRCVWPTDAEVEAALTDERPASGDRPLWDQMFNWENHADALTHPVARRLRKFRELAWNVGVRPTIETMERTKERWYHKADADHVIPLILTAGGAMSGRTRDLLLQLVFYAGVDEPLVQAETRSRLYGRISILLLKFARTMGKDQARFA